MRYTTIILLKSVPQEIRFDWTVRYLATVEYIVQNIMYVGMVIYMPAVALETVTGLDKWAAVWLTGADNFFK